MSTTSLRVLMSVLCLGLVSVFAQQPPPPPAGGPGRGGAGGGGRGNFDPAQMQQRMMARFQESLGATAEEWQVIQPRLTALMDKQRAARELSGGRGMFRGGPQGDQVAEVTALEKALEGGNADTVKTALDALRKVRTAREAEVTKAKDSLREVLSLTQEARLVLMGVLE